jgi:DNA-binding response OmpR family regulator
MLSSKDGLFDKARGRMVGSQDYLTKPFTKEQLLRAVDDYRRTAFPTDLASDLVTEVTTAAPSNT